MAKSLHLRMHPAVKGSVRAQHARVWPGYPRRTRPAHDTPQLARATDSHHPLIGHVRSAQTARTVRPQHAGDVAGWLGATLPSVGRFHGEAASADAGVADHDQRASGKVVGDLLEVGKDDRGEGGGSLVSAAEQDDARC